MQICNSIRDLIVLWTQLSWKLSLKAVNVVYVYWKHDCELVLIYECRYFYKALFFQIISTQNQLFMESENSP